MFYVVMQIKVTISGMFSCTLKELSKAAAMCPDTHMGTITVVVPSKMAQSPTGSNVSLPPYNGKGDKETVSIQSEKTSEDHPNHSVVKVC